MSVVNVNSYERSENTLLIFKHSHLELIMFRGRNSRLIYAKNQ